LPFSFSSPFFDGAPWNGLSVRTFKRTGRRPAIMVFLHDGANHIAVSPSLTQPARVPFEAGRIEFKAFDTCRDIALYRSLFALLQGIVLDETPPRPRAHSGRSRPSALWQFGVTIRMGSGTRLLFVKQAGP
jgi:hypothetical protein